MNYFFDHVRTHKIESALVFMVVGTALLMMINLRFPVTPKVMAPWAFRSS